MSQKGKDFESGGGFAKIDGKNVIYEDFTEIGDIAIYNSFTEHGCFDIDTHKPFFKDLEMEDFLGYVRYIKF